MVGIRERSYWQVLGCVVDLPGDRGADEGALMRDCWCQWLIAEHRGARFDFEHENFEGPLEDLR